MCENIKRTNTRAISGIKFLLDDKIIGGSFSEIKVWYIEFGICSQTLNNGSIHFINSIVQISNLIKASGDNKIIIWNINSDKTLKPISAHPKLIYF